MKRRFLLLTALSTLATLTASATAHADREIGLGLAYDPRVPVGALRDLVPTPGVAGLDGKWEYYAIEDRLTLGFDVQYHYFQQGNERKTVDFQNGAATAEFTRYAYFFSLMPHARWFPWGADLPLVRPFLELAAGLTSATGAVLASDLSRRSNEGGLIAQPGIGVLWTVVSRESISPWAAGAAEATPWLPSRRRESMFALSTSAVWSFSTADVLTAHNVSFFGVQLGVYTKL